MSIYGLITTPWLTHPHAWLITVYRLKYPILSLHTPWLRHTYLMGPNNIILVQTILSPYTNNFFVISQHISHPFLHFLLLFLHFKLFYSSSNFSFNYIQATLSFSFITQTFFQNNFLSFHKRTVIICSLAVRLKV